MANYTYKGLSVCIKKEEAFHLELQALEHFIPGLDLHTYAKQSNMPYSDALNRELFDLLEGYCLSDDTLITQTVEDFMKSAYAYEAYKNSELFYSQDEANLPANTPEEYQSPQIKDISTDNGEFIYLFVPIARKRDAHDVIKAVEYVIKCLFGSSIHQVKLLTLDESDNFTTEQAETLSTSM